MDCQFSQSAGMKRLRKQLQDSCEKLRIKEEIRFNTHCFLVYLLDKFRDSTAVTLAKIFTQVCSERKCVNESNPLFFLPIVFHLCLSFALNLMTGVTSYFLKISRPSQTAGLSLISNLFSMKFLVPYLPLKDSNSTALYLQILESCQHLNWLKSSLTMIQI